MSITAGEPAGSPDLVVQLAQRELAGRTGCLCRCHSPYRPGSDARFAAHPPPYSPNSPAQPQTTGTMTRYFLSRYVNLSLRGG
ncbi:hypothetical protein ACLK1S_00330 [Escherichia coli]